jgi:S-adenosylmethionine hydrolase
MKNLITLTSDFGQGEYVGAMKGVILSINPQAQIIDITHQIRGQNIIEGAYVLYTTAPFFPDSVHIGVVDPGVGTDRAGLLIECERGYLVGPDNGLLLPCARKLGLKRVFKLTSSKFLLKSISNTFHGRDIFAPVGAHLTNGINPHEIGEEWKDHQDLKLEYHEEQNGKLKGRILFVDRFGNLITSIPRDIVENHMIYDERINIEIKGKAGSETRTLRFVRTYGDEEPGVLLATISSGNFLEISCNMGSALKMIKVQPISEIVIDI